MSTTNGDSQLAEANCQTDSKAASSKEKPSFKVSPPKHVDINLLFVGEKGLGISTFINEFLKLISAKPKEGQPEYVPTSVAVLAVPSLPQPQHFYYELFTENSNTTVRLRITTLPEFGTEVSLSQAQELVVEELQQKIERQREMDERKPWEQELHKEELIHACFYFLKPHCLRQVDVSFLQRLDEYVPVIPILAKADTYSAQELTEYRKLAEKEIAVENAFEGECDRTVFAVVGNRERQYPWATLTPWNMEDNGETDGHWDNSMLTDLLTCHYDVLVEKAHTKYKAHLAKARSSQICNILTKLCARGNMLKIALTLLVLVALIVTLLQWSKRFVVPSLL